MSTARKDECAVRCRACRDDAGLSVDPTVHVPGLRECRGIDPSAAAVVCEKGLPGSDRRDVPAHGAVH